MCLDVLSVRQARSQRRPGFWLGHLEVPPTETGVAVCNRLGGNIVDFRHVEFEISQTPKWKLFRIGDLD